MTWKRKENQSRTTKTAGRIRIPGQPHSVVLASNVSVSVVLLAVNLWSAPVIIDALGPAAYAIVGVFSALWAVLSVLESAVAPILARASFNSENSVTRQKSAARILRSFEFVAVITGAVMLTIGVVTTLVIALNLLSPIGIDPLLPVVLALALAARLGESVYRPVAIGLNRQVRFNSIQIVSLFLRFVLGTQAAVVSNSIEAFFLVQAIVSIGQTAYLSRQLSSKPTLHWGLGPAWRLRRYVTSVAVITALSQLSLSSDRLFVPLTFPLGQAGAYATAALLASSLPSLVTPITSTALPVLVEYRRNMTMTRRTVLRANVIAGLPTSAVVAVLVAIPGSIMATWLGDGPTAAEASRLLPYLACASGLGAMSFATGSALVVVARMHDLVQQNILRFFVTVLGLIFSGYVIHSLVGVSVSMLVAAAMAFGWLAFKARSSLDIPLTWSLIPVVPGVLTSLAVVRIASYVEQYVVGSLSLIVAVSAASTLITVLSGIAMLRVVARVLKAG